MMRSPTPRPVGAVQEGTPGDGRRRIVRWATPVTAFQRTALEDTELSGVQIKKGQRVVMFYRSANFDEEVFEDPHSFNILRNPNPHVGFAGPARTTASAPTWQDDDQPDLQRSPTTCRT